MEKHCNENSCLKSTDLFQAQYFIQSRSISTALVPSSLKFSVARKVLHNVSVKYPEIKNYIEQNIKEVFAWESLTAQEVIYFVGFI